MENRDLRSMKKRFKLPITVDECERGLLYYYKAEIEERGGTFRATPLLKKNISLVSDFLVNEERKFGLYLYGGVGNGKTTLIKSVGKLLNYLISKDKIWCGNKLGNSAWCTVLSATDMVHQYLEDRNEFDVNKAKCCLMLDDLGDEPVKVNLYGTAFYPFVEIIKHRYEEMLPTIISSNLLLDTLCEKYENKRLIDRFIETFFIVPFNDKSFR